MDVSQLDEVIFRFLKGQATLEEMDGLQRWLAESPEHRAYFERLATMLGAAARAYSTRERAAPPPVEALIGAGRAQDPKVIELPVRARRVRRDPERPRWVGFGLAGGAVAAVLLLGIFLTWPSQPMKGGGLALTAAEYITGHTETAMVTLGDGSVVRLAPNSRLRVESPRADRREVRLDGRAFFAVAEDKRAPFVVQTASGETRVLGTRFDVEARGEETRVVVVEGQVVLATSAGEVQLGANELSVVRRDEVPRKAEVADVQGLLTWLDTFIVFQETPLSEVARELERRFGVEVRITDPALARETVTGWSNSDSVDDILTRVCLAVSARCELSEKQVVLEPNPLR